MNDMFDIQALINAINKVKSTSGCDDVEVYSWCELPTQIKELFNLLEVKHIIIPNKYYSKDFDKDALYITPKCETKIEDIRRSFYK